MRHRKSVTIQVGVNLGFGYSLNKKSLEKIKGFDGRETGFEQTTAYWIDLFILIICNVQSYKIPFRDYIAN